LLTPPSRAPSRRVSGRRATTMTKKTNNANPVKNQSRDVARTTTRVVRRTFTLVLYWSTSITRFIFAVDRCRRRRRRSRSAPAHSESNDRSSVRLPANATFSESRFVSIHSPSSSSSCVDDDKNVMVNTERSLLRGTPIGIGRPVPRFSSDVDARDHSF
jgi:hypothetical protein